MKSKAIKILFYYVKLGDIILYCKMVVITDEQISHFINEKKIVSNKFNPVLRDKSIYHEFVFEVKGENENTFRIIVRQNKINPLDFSVILGVSINGRLFKLKRYNGNLHEHINKIENQKISGFHIHKATQRYQEMGFREEGYAEVSKKYVDWRTALNSMLNDNNFLVEVEKSQERLF
jgi:hypothetical protein